MQRSKTHFEQVPVAVVKKIAVQLSDSEINCSICHKPLALETAKTDELGQGVHGDCYLISVGVKRDQRTRPSGKTNGHR
jgi:hypothetical protein